VWRISRNARIDRTEFCEKAEASPSIFAWNSSSVKKKTLLTCRKLQSAASHRRTKLLHHHHAVFMERPLQQSHDSHTCRETGLHQLCYRLNSKEKNSCAHHLLPCWSV
uniref:Uncharacterized protein n=1 Tax=Amphiprion percula TaxID=161767 RepID=A0A3P8U4E3_AMPPE